MSTYTPVAPLLMTPDGSNPQIAEDSDGYTVLVVSGDLVHDSSWQEAYDHHNVSLIVEETHGWAISVTEFLAERREVPTVQSYEVTRWRKDVEFPSLAEYYGVSSSVPSGEPGQAEDGEGDLGTFVHLHTHFEYSPMDGLSTLAEAFEVINEHGHKALGSSDHGNCAAHPEQQKLADKYGVKPIFGMEAYFQSDRFRRTRTWLELDGVEIEEHLLSPEEKKRAEKKSDSEEARWGYWHLSMWAESQNGLRNLWAMSTESYRDGLFDGKPRLDWDTLERLGDGIICGTGCLRGPVARAILDDDMDAARDRLMRLAALFPDRLYVEIHCNTLEDQKKVNLALVDLAAEYNLPLVMAVDSHYPREEQKVLHNLWVAMETAKSLGEDTGMFQGDQAYHLLSEKEVRHSASYLPSEVVDASIANTVEIARRCTAEVRGQTTTPTYSKVSKDHPDPVQRDVERLLEVCLDNWERRTKGKSYSQADAEARFEREMALLIDKKFCGYFLIVWDYVAWAKREGCLVGPSRGSGGGSFVAYLAGITETDPIENDLAFERFLTEGRTSLPDFDIDFPTSWRTRITKYIRSRWGEDYTANIGTLSRLRAKQAINDVHRALNPLLPYDIPYKVLDDLKGLIDQANAPLAGKQMPWDEFCHQFAAEVDPLREAYPEFFVAVDGVVDRLKTYGKHAAGIVISTEEPLTDLPMYLTEITETVNGKKTKIQTMVSQFDMNALEALGYVKFDILTLRTLDTLQACVDLIHEQYSDRRINPYDWTEEYRDPQVWEQVSEGRTLGLFQVETASGTRMIRRMQPSTLEDLAAVVTIVRPGPMRSGLTDSFLRRRAGIEPVTYPDPRLEEFLGDTYGSMIYQEQVMATCMNLAGYTSTEADVVRRLLGKKEVEKVQAAGQEFVTRAVQYETAQEVADLLWSQMAEFAKYGFNRAHAFAYAVLGYWTAWLKFHFPREFLLACMSTVDSDRVPEFVDECRILGYTIIPPDVNRSQTLFSADGLDVIYGLGMVKQIGFATSDFIVAHQPYTSLEDFIARAVEPEGSPVNMGHVKILVAVGAFDQIVGNRKAVEIQLEREATGAAKRCVFKTDAPNPEHPHRLPCGFDWSTEPDPPTMRKRVEGKMQTVAKPPPKACTVKCRQYVRPEPISPDEITNYSLDEIVAKEKEMLGVWISASPWDKIDPDHLDRSDTAQVIERGPVEKQYLGVAMVEAVKKRKEKASGKEYAFVALSMQDGKIEPVCFSSVWGDYGRLIREGSMGVVAIWKTPRGLQLQEYVPYPNT